jgi:hypothetical protein
MYGILMEYVTLDGCETFFILKDERKVQVSENKALGEMYGILSDEVS